MFVSFFRGVLNYQCFKPGAALYDLIVTKTLFESLNNADIPDNINGYF